MKDRLPYYSVAPGEFLSLMISDHEGLEEVSSWGCALSRSGKLTSPP
jgi:hypothetical protein